MEKLIQIILILSFITMFVRLLGYYFSRPQFILGKDGLEAAIKLEEKFGTEKTKTADDTRFFKNKKIVFEFSFLLILFLLMVSFCNLRTLIYTTIIYSIIFVISLFFYPTVNHRGDYSIKAWIILILTYVLTIIIVPIYLKYD